MRRLHLKGIVRAANHVRQALSAPMTPAARDDLARKLERSIRQIEALLARNHASPSDLPAPSRRAYFFLKQVDLSRAATAEPPDRRAAGGVVQPATVWFTGLRAFLDRILDDICLTLYARRFDGAATLRVLSQTTDRLNHTIRRDGLLAEHLTPEALHLLGWFRYFVDPPAFDAYAGAVARAQAILGRLPLARLGWEKPLLIHFRPTSHLYRGRRTPEGTRIILETPMISFDEHTLQCLGEQMLGRADHHRAITATMLGTDFQAVAANLDAATGIVERTAGMVYDLAEVFRRVNHEYLDGQSARPKLNWNRTFAGRVFGHYDFIRDRLWVSTSLDRADVPAFVLDHIMHHELLHKKHGFRWCGRRQQTHTPEFRADERRFTRYQDAARFLDQFSRK